MSENTFNWDRGFVLDFALGNGESKAKYREQMGLPSAGGCKQY